DPTQDVRWPEFVGRHRRASVFHTREWLKALQMTYGYSPVVFTTSSPDCDLADGIVCCEIDSWVTGRRLVSLPFSDHCKPLCKSPLGLEFLLAHLQQESKRKAWKYFEFRPACEEFGAVAKSKDFADASKYYLHLLDLAADCKALFESFDRDSVQRRIQHAERVGLVERCGNSDELLKHFYGLFVVTRGRHSIPPIPIPWFRNLIQC